MRKAARSPSIVAIVATVATASLTASAIAGLAACGSDDTDRPAVQSDSGNDASPPQDAGVVDSGPAVDARAPFDATEETVTCTTTPCAVQLVAGGEHFCARMSDGTVRCWGEDIWGQLGHGSPDGETRPDAGDAGAIPPVVGLANVTQISAANRTTCALLTDGSIQCWGSNYQGELGLTVDPATSDEDRHPEPVPVALEGATATRVDVGYGNVCAALGTGTISCWGDDQYTKLARPVGGGPGDGFLILGPGTAEIDAAAFTRLFGGSKTMLGLTKTGEVFSWGAISGEDGLVSGRVSSRSPDLAPKRIPGLANVTSLAVAPILWREPASAKQSQNEDRPGGNVEVHAHACAIADGEVYCWGHSFTGALCNGLPDREQQPAHAPVFAKPWPQQVAVGDETTCLRMTDGTVQCCGEGTNGALGTGVVQGFGAFFAPARAFTSHAVHVAASHSAICALVQGGTVECWGGNIHGELGIAPDKDAHPKPTKIAF